MEKTTSLSYYKFFKIGQVLKKIIMFVDVSLKNYGRTPLGTGKRPSVFC